MFGELWFIVMEIWWLEKCKFDDISWRLDIRGRIFVLTQRKHFHVHGDRWFGCESVKFNFEILFILFSCCVKLGADFVVSAHFVNAAIISWCALRRLYRLGHIVWMKYIWSGVIRSVAVFRVSLQILHLVFQWSSLQIP